MRYVFTLIAGIALGAASWGLGAMLSGTFEPFDSLVGFLTTQVILGVSALVCAFRSGGKHLLALVFGGYLGLNLYPYAFGGPESRVWAALGAVTTLSLMFLPLLVGAAGWLVRRYRTASKGKGAS